MKNATPEHSAPLPWEFDGESVFVETPEQTLVEYHIAPLGARFAAALLDLLVITGFVAALFLLGLLSLGLLSLGLAGAGGRDAVMLLITCLLVAWFLIPLFYHVWGEVRGEGQTWGKRRMGVRAILSTGQGVTLGAALVRNLARIIDRLPPLWIIPALSSGNRRLGDFLAGTLVVLVESPERPKAGSLESLASSSRDLDGRRFHFSSTVAKKLYRDDLNLVEHVEERLRLLGSERRRRVTEEVARRYIDRLGLHEESEAILAEPRRFLQEMALFLRERYERQAY